MLFHVTMTHTEDNCPAYHPELMPDLIAAIDKFDEVAEELGVKAHFLVGNAGHITFALLEADNLEAISRLVFSIPIRSDIEVAPVGHIKDATDMGREIMERAQAEK